jgi:hypothetical protein
MLTKTPPFSPTLYRILRHSVPVTLGKLLIFNNLTGGLRCMGNYGIAWDSMGRQTDSPQLPKKIGKEKGRPLACDSKVTPCIWNATICGLKSR